MCTGKRRKIKIAFIGGGSEMWAPTIIRDIILKNGMDQLDIEFALLDTCIERSQSIKSLFDIKLKEWNVDRVRIYPTVNAPEALSNADFVIIAISTGRLDAMRHDLEIPEKYGIYHTVGDTSGPGGWSRALRNIPVFKAYAEQIKEYCPDAYVLNYTNPMGALTKILADELGSSRVVGLCHGVFECYDILMPIFGVNSESEIQLRYGGLNHFFWILDMKVNGVDGYRFLREKLDGRNFVELMTEIHTDSMGWSSDKWLSGELLERYGYLPYVGDRHTCEFFNCYMADLETQERLKLKRTSIADRESMYSDAGESIRLWTEGKPGVKGIIDWTTLSREPSREVAADIIKAIVFNQEFKDVVNMPNVGQIDNLPRGAVVETPGYVDGLGFTPLAIGDMPENLRALIQPHAEVQLRTVKAGLSGDMDEALAALAADPICAHLAVSDINRMGLELLDAHKEYLPQFPDSQKMFLLSGVM